MSKFSVPASAALLLAVLLTGCAHGPDADPETPEVETSGTDSFAEETGIPYTVVIDGADEIGLTDLMLEASHLVALEDKPPSSLNGLRRRARDDAVRMVGVLRSRGYYAGTVTADVEDAETPVATLRVFPGDAYMIGAFDIAFAGDPPAVPAPEIEELGIVLGMRAAAETVVDGERALLAHFAESGYPLARRADRKVTVDHETQLMSVSLVVETGPPVAFGAVRFTGLETVRADYPRKLVPWKRGDVYQASVLESYRRSLRESGLFATVSAKVVDIPDGGGQAPVAVTVTEAAHRSLGAGVSYATSEGPGAKAYWEHRNLWGGGETLRLTASGSFVEQGLEASYRKPEFLARRQDFLALVSAEREDSDAYERIGLGVRAGLERRSARYWKTGVFGTAEVSRIKDDDGRRLSKLFGLPVQLEHDSTDNLLDPTEGSRFGLYATPYAGHADDLLTFGVLEGRGSVYRALDDSRNIVLAGRLRLGSIVGESRKDVPADKRFYAGGGGSIRGYEYRIVGPLDDEGEPEGGLSVIELGAELRFKVADDFGIVPFIDGGLARDDLVPSPTADVLWAGGLGLRYYTPIGPLRFDVALPINGRKDVDETFQIYLSLGQAF